METKVNFVLVWSVEFGRIFSPKAMAFIRWACLGSYSLKVYLAVPSSCPFRGTKTLPFVAGLRDLCYLFTAKSTRIFVNSLLNCLKSIHFECAISKS